MPRTMRTLPKCLTLDRDSLIFKPFERNTVQVFAGGPISEVVGWGYGGVCVSLASRELSRPIAIQDASD
jgi:hypothetical protein